MRRLMALGFTIATVAASHGLATPAAAEGARFAETRGDAGAKARAAGAAGPRDRPEVRVSVHREVRLGFLKGTRDAVPGMSEDFLAVGLGPVMGFDVEVSPGVSFCCKLGFLVIDPVGWDSPHGGEGPSIDGGNMYAGVGLTISLGGQSR